MKIDGITASKEENTSPKEFNNVKVHLLSDKFVGEEHSQEPAEVTIHDFGFRVNSNFITAADGIFEEKTDSENRLQLVDYLGFHYPNSPLQFSTKNDAWLITEAYITKIIKDQEDEPDKIQQTPSNYLRSLVYQLQGLDTAGLTDLEVVKLYCR